MSGTASSITGAYTAESRIPTTSHDGVTTIGTPRMCPSTTPGRNDLPAGALVTRTMLRGDGVAEQPMARRRRNRGGATTVQRVSDDAELRARIEAQVAARRAGSPSSENGHPTADEPDTDDSSSATTLAGGPRSLTPTRPWTRAPRPPENGAPKGADAPP